MHPEQDRFLEQLYCDTYRRLLIYASRLLHDPNQAEDAVQSTFFEAIEHVDEPGICASTVRRRLKRIRAKLRKAAYEDQKATTEKSQETAALSEKKEERVAGKHHAWEPFVAAMRAAALPAITSKGLRGRFPGAGRLLHDGYDCPELVSRWICYGRTHGRNQSSISGRRHLLCRL